MVIFTILKVYRDRISSGILVGVDFFQTHIKKFFININCYHLRTELVIVTMVNMVFSPEVQAVCLRVFTLTPVYFSLWGFLKDAL